MSEMDVFKNVGIDKNKEARGIKWQICQNEKTQKP